MCLHFIYFKKHGSLLVLATMGGGLQCGLYLTVLGIGIKTVPTWSWRWHDTDFPLLDIPIAEPESVQIISEEAIFHVLS